MRCMHEYKANINVFTCCMYIGQQQDHAGSPAKNSTPMDQPQRKPVGRWCVAGSVEQPGIIGWQIEVVAVYCYILFCLKFNRLSGSERILTID